MRNTSLIAAVFMFLALGAAQAQAQADTPAEQPSFIRIYMEDIKLGHASAYEQTASGWPEAQAEADFSGIYLALQSLTGPDRVWYVEAYANDAEAGARMKEVEGNPALSTELQRLWDAHGQHLADNRIVELVGRPDLSGATFPDLNMQRFWDITVFRVKPGAVPQFEAAAQKYRELAPNATFRTYQVTSGMPTPTFMIFNSVAEYAEWDDRRAANQSIFADVSDDDMEVFTEFSTQAEASTVSYRFQLSPTMSYVNAEMKAADPAFWNQN